MSPFKILGLPNQADIAQIKHAYAKLLRSHRPDEDAEGFQRLHDAYRNCLQQALWRETRQDDADDISEQEEKTTVLDAAMASDESVHAPVEEQKPRFETIIDAPSTAMEDTGAAAHEDHFDAPGFIEELAWRMHADPRESLDRWLRSHEGLYSLERKHALSHDVVEVLGEAEPAHAARHFEHVTSFFGLDTVAGVEPWLQNRLGEIRSRFEDCAGFERLLRLHAGSNADWADQRLARELINPFNWPRRIFLISCPGMPGRIGELARALHTADPASASAQLNGKAMRFWQRVTDRSALNIERLGFMAARVAIWSVVVIGFISLVEDGSKGLGRGFAGDLAAGFGIAFGLWLAYALAVLALFRFRDFNQTRMQWDMSLVISTLGLGCGVIAVAMGSSGVFVWIMTTMYWLRARHDGRSEGYTSAQAAALLAGMSGFALAFLVLRKTAPISMPIAYQACAAALFAFASQLAHDVVLSRARGISLRDARQSTGWLWAMFGIQTGAAVLLSLVLR